MKSEAIRASKKLVEQLNIKRKEKSKRRGTRRRKKRRRRRRRKRRRRKKKEIHTFKQIQVVFFIIFFET